MTKEQAAKILTEAFPGKRHYISCHQWTYESGKVQPPDFSVCVYLGPDNDHASGDGRTLGEAVELALAKRPANVEADAMFASGKQLQPVSA